MFGRLINGKFEYAPKNIVHNGKLICNPKPDFLLKLGYLPVKLTESSKKEGYVSIFYWEKEGNKIVQKWKFEKIEREMEV